MESEHFKSAELRCRHCGREGVRTELLDVLEVLRAKAGPLKVNSAYRCPQHPVEARKPKPGFHARGLAADLVPLAMPLRAFYDVVRAERGSKASAWTTPPATSTSMYARRQSRSCGSTAMAAPSLRQTRFRR